MIYFILFTLFTDKAIIREVKSRKKISNAMKISIGMGRL